MERMQHGVKSVLLGSLILLLASVPVVLLSKDSQLGKQPPPAPTGAIQVEKFQKMPLYFIENRGQLDSRVAYYVQGRDTTLYFTAEGLTLVQTEQKRGENSAKGRLEKASLGRGIPAPDAGSRWVVKLDFVGANPNSKITAGDRLPAVISYFKGPKENWKAGLSTYGSIVYSDLWPGIDLVYSGTANRLKYTFLVKPGADPAQVRLAYRGVRGIRLNDAGQLEVETPAGGFRDDKPYAYQEVKGRRVEINVAYSLDRESAGGLHRYGFALDSYDRSKPLVLDPAVFVYAGYIGGSGNDQGNGIAVDSSGNAYVTGTTGSSEATFPVTVGPDLTYNGVSDAFVAKVNAAGTGLVYCGYIGGSDLDAGRGIAVDSFGNAYVTGYTQSTEATFPVTLGPDLTYNGGGDAFVAKVNAAGTGLVYCGYIGGSGGEGGRYGIGIAVDSSGNAYVTGTTGSSEATFPVTVGPDLIFNGGDDAFVAKVNAAGTGLVYCGYIGGSGNDQGNGIAVDSSGNAYVTGLTGSTEATFPVTVGPDLTYNGSGGFVVGDAFVAKVNAAGTGLVYAGYIGGSGDDYGIGIAVDTSGNAYVTGTGSSEATFPVIVGPDLTYNGGDDAFVAKVNAAGTALVYCGYIGGSSYDEGFGIAVDSSGNAYVTGYTDSTEATFPVTVGPDLTYHGGNDAFVAKVNAAGTGLVYAGYIGGSDLDAGRGIAVDTSGNAYVTGGTSSTEATFPVTVGPDLTFNGGGDLFNAGDAFVAKIAEVGGAAEPVFRVIAGSPLTIHVGDDLSFQIFNSTAPGQGQIFPSDCTSTADMGVFVRIGTTLYAPNFAEHPCGSAAGIDPYTAWTPVSISAVTGTGTAGDPFTVVVVVDAGTTGLRLTMTVSYVNGEGFFRESYAFTSSTGPITFDVFTGADIYLADSDDGVPYYDVPSGSPGGQVCVGASYTILFIPLTSADAYSANSFGTVWSEIAAGALSNTVAQGCQDNGAALQWSNRTVSPSSPLTIQTATSFGAIPTIGQFRVDSVTPSSGNPGQTVTVVVTGIGFESGTTFDFGAGITINSTTINSANQATLSISISSGAALGFRNVTGSQSSEGPTHTLVNGFEIRSTCSAITVSPSTLPDGTFGSPYNQTITASGGTAPYTFSVTAGSLPPGLSLSSGGVLSGTPTSGGSYSFTVTATDANQCMGSRAYTVTIAAGCPVITVSPTSLANATVGGTVRRTFSASGGTAPYTFRRTAGSFPPGLSLSTAGVLSGSPTTPGTYSFTVTATDANQCSGSRAYTLRIVCATVTVSPAALVSGVQGTAYSQTLTASGGRAPHTFAVTGGALPAGLVLSSGGVLSGTPTVSGSFTFTVTATDAGGCSGSATYTLSVCVAGLTLSPGALPAGTVGSGYGQTLVASGGVPPYAFAVTAGALPAGLTLSPAGTLSGTPTAAGLFSFTVTATDANGCPGVGTYALRVCPVVAIAPTTLPEGAVGTAYSQALTGSGGTGPYIFAASGSLPPGLALSPTGALSGTPTETGSFSFTVTAADVNGCAVSQGYSVRVTDAPPAISDLNLAPGDVGSFTLSVTGSGFVEGAVVVVNGVSYPTTFVSPTLLTVTLPASAVPASGSITVIVTNPGATGGTSNAATLTFCSAPGAPLNPTIAPADNPTGPITATDFLQVRWDAPATGPAPVFYAYRINGDAWSGPVVGTSAVVFPRGSNDPITLYVRAHCNAEVSSPEAASPTYSLAPPVADFTFSTARVGSPVTFTDTSSPQATSWLWIFDDGATSTEQSPTHSFTTAGTHRVALIASNGSGSDLEIKDVAVSASTSSGGAVTSSVRSFERSEAGRWRLPEVAISGAQPVWLELTSEATEETIVYLRFIDSEGWVVLERRLSVAPGQPAVNDVGAYGLEGLYTLELVSSQPISAALVQQGGDAGEELTKPRPSILP